MNWTNFPSLNSLRAFAALAETGSYTGAGVKLSVSHAAVSHQVQALEARLGVSLVIREGRGIKLTSEGATLARQLAKGLSIIRDGVEALKDSEGAHRLQVTTSPAFAANWLMPRLGDFQRRHPDITLMLNPTAEVIEIGTGEADIAIRFGKGEWPDVIATPLLLPDMVVVAARRLIDEQSTDLKAFAQMPWLQELGTDEVAEWIMQRQVQFKSIGCEKSTISVKLSKGLHLHRREVVFRRCTAICILITIRIGFSVRLNLSLTKDIN